MGEVVRLCSIDGCQKASRNVGWCHMHYTRWRRHGDPLFLKRAENGAADRYIQTTVLTYEGDECLVWPFNRNPAGYATVARNYGGTGFVQRIVCEAIHGPAPTAEHQAAHSCGKGTDGCVTKRHLSWKTPLDNTHDKYGHGTIYVGERSHRAKLTTNEVLEIRRLVSAVSQRALSRRFGVSPQTIWCVVHRESWTHV